MVRSIFISMWSWIDPLYFWFTRLQYICPESKDKGMFRVRLTRYKGKEVILSDGIKIRKNDLLLKIHLHNVRIFKDVARIKNDVSRGRFVFRGVMESMPLLSDYILNHPENSNIKGIIGITLINKGFKPLGFECIQPDSKIYARFKQLMQTPIWLLSNSHPLSGKKGIQCPVYLMMSKEKLLEKYKR
ncbi:MULTISPECIES: hypothetical protein [unclassified Bacillus (in: firmicutes)]|uniref:YkoP family protein n=1 Tax=unclassified Bacillus (in: firmicutes) TaxID=185979 RepID=UPI001BEA9464|nr:MULTISPECIES: hypothetical protein [unclassified Bacillus (in: firmicutes)]MBT2638023.1 hypothetical protein [Bacillus sp. ISL-39]MBT2661198.1 hypothetical protein [Bacillus sp. ISL-45]